MKVNNYYLEFVKETAALNLRLHDITGNLSFLRRAEELVGFLHENA